MHTQVVMQQWFSKISLGNLLETVIHMSHPKPTESTTSGDSDVENLENH
jgi:hypothetical protein